MRCAAEGVAALWLVNRTEDRAQVLAREMAALGDGKETRLEVGYPEGKVEVDVVINATSAGLKPGDPLPYDPKRWEPGRAAAAYDLIYRPAETPFLAAAKAVGARTANGLGMLLYQGAAALEIWSGRTAPVAEMRRALWAQVYGESELGR